MAAAFGDDYYDAVGQPACCLEHSAAQHAQSRGRSPPEPSRWPCVRLCPL